MQPVTNIVPGLYSADGQAQLLRANEQAYLFNNQAISAGQASIAVQLERIKSTFYPFGASFQLFFSGDPGVFEVDIETSDIDASTQYVNINKMNSGLNSNFVGRLELPSFWAKYVRAKVVTITNPVKSTLLVTR